MTPVVRRSLTLAAAVLLLDVSLTFTNLWPTPAIGWHGELSVEVAATLIAFAAIGHRASRPSARLVRWLGAAWALLVIGRYADVTSAALYGRDINLYWDLRYIPDVGKMVVAAAPLWLVALAVSAAVAVFGLLFALLRRALARLAEAAADASERRVLIGLGLLLVLGFLAERGRATPPEAPWFPTPVTATYARQARLMVQARSAGRATSVLAAPEPPAADLARVRQTDVLLVFMESYGAVSYDRPEIADRLQAARARFADDIRESGRDVVSAFVESPTFGGSSWLAHLSLVSGVEVRDPDAYALLMTAKRRTAVTAFGSQGFRTVAMMPGLKKSWPEGAFYGFDDIRDAEHITYQGPWYGWFGIPDEATFANLDALQTPASRPPFFVFLPTLSTHFPFGPTPPYQEDWQRMLTAEPYPFDEAYDALAEEPDWTNFRPGYAKAVAYAYRSIGGYLRQRTGHDLVMILLGDHQPPAAVSGDKAPWDVPVHVIASNRAVLDRLVARGFHAGLTPARPDVSRMHGLLPLLLDAFSGQN